MTVWPCCGLGGMSARTRGVGDLCASESGEGCCWVGVGVELLVTADAVFWISIAINSDEGLFAFCALTRAEAGFGEEESGGVGNREAPPVDEICLGSASVSADSQDLLEGVALGTEGR